MLQKREITRETLGPLLRLKVRPDQENLVAPNAWTIAQAAYESMSAVYGLWNDDCAIGLFAMLDVPRHPDSLQPDDIPDAAFLWRLLISAEYQGKGYGRAAIEMAKEVSRSWGYTKLASTVVDAPNSSMRFYEAVGFHQTGGIVGDELVIVMEI